MFPEQDINRHNYQLRFMEMENKIKKCELERAELEQRFSQLMRERQECERAAARQLKLKYKRMMELDRQRADRNESLLRMLHKIDQQATSLAAKTDRLKMLKTQYESYLIRSWSSQRALPPCSPVPSMYSLQPQFFPAPQQTTPFQFPPRASESPKSEFVRYLSDMTHAQTVSYNPIPPPTALSNYINHQQLPMHQQYTSSFLAPTPTFTQDPFLRPPPRDIPPSPNITTLNPPTEPAPIPQTPHRAPSTVPQVAKKFDLSNEEFIQYIDNEILKGSTTTASAVAGNDPPPDIVIEPPTIASTPLPVAYLEDFTNDVDEDLLQPPPGTSRFLDDSPIIEEIVKATANLELNDDSSFPLDEIQSLEVSDDAVINQRWEKVVEVNSSVRPPSAVPPQDTVEEPLLIRSPPLQDVITRTLRGVISEVEERREAPAVSDDLETDVRELPKEEDAPHSSEQDELASTSAAFGEMQPEYLQPSYDQEVVYQQEHYLPPDDAYPPTTQDCQEAPPPEYTAQEPVEYAYDYGPTDVAQSNETHWSTARQAVRTKSYATTNQSRTPETIDEVVSNGETSPHEKRSTPSGSKRTSPTGENLSATEIHSAAPVDPEPEQPPPEDPQQYDYSQYQPEYDPNVDYQHQQQDGVDQQTYYQQQYATDDQSGQQDPSQVQPYQEYADVDPNQYQQATEYPGPTQYVFEQGYYDEQPQEQQSDQQQQGYYEDPNAVEQQYYGEENQQQQSDQAYYDQSQEQQEYANYEATAVEGDGQVVDVAPQVVQEEVKEGKEDEEEVRVEQREPSSTLMSSVSVAGVESTEEKVEEMASESDGKSESPVKQGVTGKEDTTISSANDESDFDFSTQ
ncbi:titin-like [Ochlerotatus camptorhynchus]|uniref:titin-like n=1 Tax=Ochlerotatus camptorhynchus TaxID=644619 RepID=UPI0031D748A8